MFCMLAGYAQGSSFTEAEEVTGDFSFTPTSQYEYNYYKYTPTEDCVLTASLYGYAYVYTDTTSTYLTYRRAYDYTNSVYVHQYILSADTEYYIKIYNYYVAEISVTFDDGGYSQLGKGTSEDDPIELAVGESYLIGAATSTYSYSSKSSYATYEAEASNLLKLTTIGTSATIYVDDSESSLSYDSYGKSDDGFYEYVYYISLTEGEETSITFSGYYLIAFTVDTLTVEPGSELSPFEIDAVGEDSTTTAEIPAAAGEYWYTFNPSNTGYYLLASTSEATAQVFESKSYYNYYVSYGDYYIAASGSVADSVRFEVDSYSTGQDWVIIITKDSDTDAAEELTLTYQGYEAGETEDNPIELTGPWPMTITTDYASGETFYSVTLPESGDSTYIEVGMTTVPTSSYYTGVYVYDPDGGWYATSAYGYRSTSMEGTAGSTYVIDWSYEEDEPITFTVNIRPVGEGDSEDSAYVAVEGANIIKGIGTRYYSYTAEQDGKCELTVPDGAEWGSYYNYDASSSGNTYTFEITEAETYTLDINYAYEGDTLTIVVGEYGAGESMGTAYDASETGSYSVTDSEDGYSALWIKYTAQIDGFLTFTVDNLDYSYYNTVRYYYPSGDDYTYGSLYTYSYSDGSYTYTYEKTIACEAGSTYYVYISSSYAFSDVTVTFEESEASKGEVMTNPIELTVNEETLLGLTPSTSKSGYVWCKVALIADSLATFTTNESAYMTGYLFEGMPESATSYSGEYMYLRQNYSYAYDTITPATTGDYYLRISYLNGTYDIDSLYIKVEQNQGTTEDESDSSTTVLLTGTTLPNYNDEYTDDDGTTVVAKNEFSGSDEYGTEGFSIAITGNRAKTLNAQGSVTVDGTAHTGIKTSNKAENTLYFPDDVYVTNVTIYAYANGTLSSDCYWAEFNGVSYTVDDNDYNTTDGTDPGIASFDLDNVTGSVTFKNAGIQPIFVISVTYNTGDDTETGISTVNANAVIDATINVYNLSGMKVMSTTNAADINSLSKGLYIINGKKVVIK